MAKFYYDVYSIRYIEELENPNFNADHTSSTLYAGSGITPEGYYRYSNYFHSTFQANTSYLYPFGNMRTAVRRFVYSHTSVYHVGKLYKIVGTKGDFIETIIGDELDFPDDGVKDKLWYVKGRKALPKLTLQGRRIKELIIKTPEGDRKVIDLYITDSQGRRRNLVE